MADPVSRRPIPSFFIDSILRRDSPGRSASLRSALTSGDDDDDDDGCHGVGCGGDGSSGGGEGCRGGGGGSAGGGDSDDSDSDPGGSQRPGQLPGLPALQFPPQLAGEPVPRNGAGYAPPPPLTQPPPHLLLHRADAGRPPPPAPPPLTSRYPDSVALGPEQHRRIPDNYHHRAIGVVQTGRVGLGLGLGLGGGGVCVGGGREELPADTDVLEACCLDSGCPEYGPGPRVAAAGQPVNYGTEVLIADGILHCDGGGGRGEERLPAGDSGLGLPRDEPKQPEVVSDLGDDGKKRPRTAFSADQVRSLEQEFQRSKYLSVSKRTEMSRQLGLTEQQIKIWFQNRRTKWKRKYTNNLEILAQQHYLRMGLLPPYPFNPPDGATKPAVGTGFGGGGVFGGPGLGGRPQLFPGPQSAVRLYSPFSTAPALPRM